MMDSTNAEVPGFASLRPPSARPLDQAFAQATRKIIVASFSSHVHRVQQAVDAAHKYGRKVVFVGRSMVRNMSIAADLGYLHIPEGTVVDLKQANDIQDDKLVFMCTGSQGGTDGRTRPHRRRQPPRHPHQRVRHRDSRQLPDSRQ